MTLGLFSKGPSPIWNARARALEESKREASRADDSVPAPATKASGLRRPRRRVSTTAQQRARLCDARAKSSAKSSRRALIKRASNRLTGSTPGVSITRSGVGPRETGFYPAISIKAPQPTATSRIYFERRVSNRKTRSTCPKAPRAQVSCFEKAQDRVYQVFVDRRLHSAQHTVDPDPLTGYVVSRLRRWNPPLGSPRASPAHALADPSPPRSKRRAFILLRPSTDPHLRNALDAGRRHSASQ
jgi:hypothetical protein